MGFPDDAELGTRVEANIGGTWTDITPDTRLGQLIRVTRGRSDWATRIDPSKVTAQIRNTDGKYSPRNPLSPYYGKLGRNTPLRASVAAGTPWLALPASGPARVRATTPDAAALDITADIDMRFEIEPADWNAGNTNVLELGGKWATGQKSYQFYLFAGGLHLGWTTDGTTEITRHSTPVLNNTVLTRWCVRATLDVNNGASGHAATFYTGPTLAGPWTAVGAPIVTAGTTSIFSGTASLEVGDVSAASSFNAEGRLYRAEIRNGINGTVVANPDFTAQAVGATGFSDAAGRAWTVNSASGITNRNVRGIGEVPSWPPRWGSSGKLVTVDLEAAGITRRLGQGSTPLDSTLRRRIPSDPNLIAYWPCEDGDGSTQAYSPLQGVAPMAMVGMNFAADDTLAGSAPLPTLGDVSSRRANVPLSTAGQWRVEFVYKIDGAPAGDANAQLIVVNTSTAQWRIGVGASLLHLDVTTLDGASLLSTTFAPTNFFGLWTRLVLNAQQSGSNINYVFNWIPIGLSGAGSGGTFAGTAGRVTALTSSHGSNLSGSGFGHFAVFNTASTSIFDSADMAFSGESVATRVVRLAGEESVPLSLPYGSAGTEPMGAQTRDTLLNLLQAGADTDEGGILYERRDQVTLAYRPRVSLYNQTPKLILDYAESQVGVPLEPEDDDQATRNDITVTRAGGSSARATLDAGALSTQDPPSGVGRYTDAVTLSLANDDQPELHAGWRLHMGTYDGVRYPSVTINLAKCPELIDDARELDIGDRIQILNPPAWLPPGPIDLIVQGVAETLGIRTWGMTFNCSPAGPWTIGVVEDPILGRVGTGGLSKLASAATSTATSLSVTVAGDLWRTTTTNYPLDIVIGGERMTLTAVSGASSPQTFTVTRSVNGIIKAQAANAVIQLAAPAIVAL